MLTNHIKAPFFGLHDIKLKRFICRSGIESIRPPTLIQRAELEQSFIIERHTLTHLAVIIISADGYLTHSCIAFHFVGPLSLITQGNTQSIKIRMVGRPSIDCWQCNHCLSIFHLCRSYYLCRRSFGIVAFSTFKHFYLYLIPCTDIRGSYIHCKSLLINIGNSIIRADMIGGYGFHPNSLPNTCYWRIPYT